MLRAHTTEVSFGSQSTSNNQAVPFSGGSNYPQPEGLNAQVDYIHHSSDGRRPISYTCHALKFLQDTPSLHRPNLLVQSYRCPRRDDLLVNWELGLQNATDFTKWCSIPLTVESVMAANQGRTPTVSKQRCDFLKVLAYPESSQLNQR